VSGCRRVTLDTTAVLVRARRFYERSGFTLTGRTTDFFGIPVHEYAAALDPTFGFCEATSEDAAAILRLINAAFLVERHFVTGDRIGEEDLRRCFDKGTFLVAARDGASPSASLFLRPNGERRTYLG